jgi:hypothetical protein
MKIGPPHDSDFNTLNVTIHYDFTCGNGWICEHRWRQIYKMVAFRNIVEGEDEYTYSREVKFEIFLTSYNKFNSLVFQMPLYLTGGLTDLIKSLSPELAEVLLQLTTMISL